MNSVNRERVKELLSQASRLPRQERAVFIERAAGTDRESAAEAIDLLATLDDPEFMSAPTGAGLAAALPHMNMPGEGPGTRIDRYKLLQLIGEGGFGSVFMAEQVEPVNRKVALKIIKAGMDTKQVIARFEAERQALALMDHPNIARVLDAGATKHGRLYFVMELVRGEPCTKYCDRERLPVPQRLKLFRDVCNAVQHAHQKGIIHRDLKPSNVLVTVADGEPLPKVIDFGIAKATASRLTDKTLFTEMHQLIGTPEYMSPEQAEVSGVDIDTRSDIYSLGVLLYELLVGSTPIEATRLRSTPLMEIQRLIREEEPPRPSIRLATLASSANGSRISSSPESVRDTSTSSAIEVAQRRSTEPLHLGRTIRGDLDWIVMKCLEKDRRRRYPTVSALADDIALYLAHEPVSATPPSARYKLRKFVQRNRAIVTSVLAIAAVLVLGVIGTTLGLVWAVSEGRESNRQKNIAEKNAVTARSEAERANSEADQARAINEFMREILTSAVPGKQGAQVRLVEVLSKASQSASYRFTGHPLQEAKVRDMLGGIYDSLSQWPEAKAEFLKAQSLWREHAGVDDPRALSSEYMSAAMSIQLQQPREAEQLLTELMPKMTQVLGPNDRKTLEARRSLAMVWLQRGWIDQAEQVFLELRHHPQLVDDDDMQIRIVQSLTYVYRHRANVDDLEIRRKNLEIAEPLAREWVLLLSRRRGPDSVSTWLPQETLAEIICLQGDFESAAEICRTILAKSTESLGECHYVRYRAMATLALALTGLGEDAESADLYLQNIDCVRQNNPADSPQLLSDLFVTGRFKCSQSRSNQNRPGLMPILYLIAYSTSSFLGFWFRCAV